MSRTDKQQTMQSDEQIRERLARFAAENEQLRQQLATLRGSPVAVGVLNRLQLAHILDSAEDAVMAVDCEGRINYWNAAAERMFGYSAEEIIGQPISLLAQHDMGEEQQGIFDTIQSGGQIANLETVRFAKDGTPRHVSLTVSPVINEAGGRVGFSGIIRDISERKRIEVARRTAEESLRSSNRLLAVIQDLQSKFIADAPADVVFDALLAALLTTSESEYGFIGEVHYSTSGRPYLKTHAITNIAWNEETERFFKQFAPDGLEFENMQTLFGSVITSGETVISNTPLHDSRSGGVPMGHPPIKAFLGIPLYSHGELVGMAGMANRVDGYDEELTHVLAPLCVVCASLVTAYRTERERKQTEMALQASEVRFRALVENSYDVINLLSAEGELVYSSPSVTRVLGYSPDELLGTPGRDLVHPEDLEDAQQGFAHDVSKPNGISHRIHRLRHKDGSYRTAEITSMNLLHESGINAMVSIFRDVTDRVRAGEALKQSEQRFRSLIQNAPDAIMVMDLDQGCLVELNDNAVTLFGYSREEFLSLHPRCLSPPVQPDGSTFDEAFERLLPELMAGAQVTFEWMHLRADGSEFPTEVRLIKFPSRTGRQIRSSVVDITCRKQQEKQLREQEQALAHVSRLSTLGEMVAGIAHEINQPLGAISNYAAACTRAIKSLDAPDLPLSEWTRQISEQAVRCGDIIRRLREFVKKTEDGRSSLDLNEIVRESVALMEFELQRSSVNIVYELDESVPSVHGNRIQLEQVVVNLLRNACEALSQRDLADRTVLIRSNALQDWVRLTVEDSGPGVEQDSADEVFNAFFTTKPDGLGMGLAISRSIIDAHGGRLWIDHDHDEGATFHVELPLSKEAAKVRAVDSQAG